MDSGTCCQAWCFGDFAFNYNVWVQWSAPQNAVSRLRNSGTGLAPREEQADRHE